MGLLLPHTVWQWAWRRCGPSSTSRRRDVVFLPIGARRYCTSDTSSLSSRGVASTTRTPRAASSPSKARRSIDGLPSITVPTLVIVGDQDKPFLPPCEYMAKKIHGARLETIVGAGHSSNLDRPDAFNRVLLDFLRALPAA